MCIGTCPRHLGWTRRSVVQALKRGRFMPGLAYNSPVLDEVRQWVRARISEVHGERVVLLARLAALEVEMELCEEVETFVRDAHQW